MKICTMCGAQLNDIDAVCTNCGAQQQMPTQQMPTQQMFNQQMPNQQMPNQQMPNQQMPTQQMPNQQMPNQQMPNQQMPNQQMPTQQMPNQQMFNPQMIYGQQMQFVPKKPFSWNKPEKMVWLLIPGILVAATLLFHFVASLSYLGLFNIKIDTSNLFSAASDVYNHIEGTVTVTNLFSIFALITVLGGVGFGIVPLIFGIKNKNAVQLFASIILLSISLFLLITTIVEMSAINEIAYALKNLL